MSSSYFERCKIYQEEVYGLGEKILDPEVQEKTCKNCPHRNDSHSMNCVECCIVDRAIEKVKNNNSKKEKINNSRV